MKNILWKPGINGCGIGRFKAPFRELFRPACEIHDAMYDLGGDRFEIDKKFLIKLLELAKKRTHVVFAILYYCLVRMFGWLFFNYENKDWTGTESL